jgi:hypothetical protein
VPAPAPAAPPPAFVLTRAVTATEPTLLIGVGSALVIAAVITGDTDWTLAAIVAAVLVVASVATVASGGGPRRRMLDGVRRFLPAQAVQVRSERSTGLRRGLPLLLILAPLAVQGSLLAGGALGVGFGLTLVLDLRLVRRWERQHGARLAYEHWSWSYRLEHLFNVPEHVGVRDRATPTDRTAAARGTHPGRRRRLRPMTHDRCRTTGRATGDARRVTHRG